MLHRHDLHEIAQEIMKEAGYNKPVMHKDWRNRTGEEIIYTRLTANINYILGCLISSKTPISYDNEAMILIMNYMGLEETVDMINETVNEIIGDLIVEETINIEKPVDMETEEGLLGLLGYDVELTVPHIGYIINKRQYYRALDINKPVRHLVPVGYSALDNIECQIQELYSYDTFEYLVNGEDSEVLIVDNKQVSLLKLYRQNNIEYFVYKNKLYAFAGSLGYSTVIADEWLLELLGIDEINELINKTIETAIENIEAIDLFENIEEDKHMKKNTMTTVEREIINHVDNPIKELINVRIMREPCSEIGAPKMGGDVYLDFKTVKIVEEPGSSYCFINVAGIKFNEIEIVELGDVTKADGGELNLHYFESVKGDWVLLCADDADENIEAFVVMDKIHFITKYAQGKESLLDYIVSLSLSEYDRVNNTLAGLDETSPWRRKEDKHMENKTNRTNNKQAEIRNRAELIELMEEAFADGGLSEESSEYGTEIYVLLGNKNETLAALDIETGEFLYTEAGKNKANNRQYISLPLPSNDKYMLNPYIFRVITEGLFGKNQTHIDRFNKYKSGMVVYREYTAAECAALGFSPKEHIMGPCVDHCVVNHINGDSSDNRDSNLECDTETMNNVHARFMAEVHNHRPDMVEIYGYCQGKPMYRWVDKVGVSCHQIRTWNSIHRGLEIKAFKDKKGDFRPRFTYEDINQMLTFFGK